MVFGRYGIVANRSCSYNISKKLYHVRYDKKMSTSKARKFEKVFQRNRIYSYLCKNNERLPKIGRKTHNLAFYANTGILYICNHSFFHLFYFFKFQWAPAETEFTPKPCYSGALLFLKILKIGIFVNVICHSLSGQKPQFIVLALQMINATEKCRLTVVPSSSDFQDMTATA